MPKQSARPSGLEELAAEIATKTIAAMFESASPLDIDDDETNHLMETFVDAVRAERYGAKACAEVDTLAAYLAACDSNRPATRPTDMETTFNMEGNAREVAGFRVGLALGRRLGGAR